MSEAPVCAHDTVGICVSGGGLRAASFGLGALQALHEERELLRGETSARWISAVSGGSYIAGAFTLVNAGSRARYCDGSEIGARDLKDKESPLAPGSPEAGHLLRHCRYLVEDGGLRTVANIAVLVGANVVTLTVLIFWLGMMVIGNFGMLGLLMPRLNLPQWMANPAAEWLIGIAGLAVLVAIFAVSKLLPIWARLFLLLLVVIPIWTMPFLARRLTATPLLRSPRWLGEHLIAIVLVGGSVTAVLFLLYLIGRWRPAAALRFVIGGIAVIIATVAPWVVAAILISWAAVLFFSGYFEPVATGSASVSQTVLGLAGFYATLVAMILIAPLPGLISPHRPYRTLISRCFAVRRTSDDTADAVPRPDEVAMSSLLPPTEKGSTKYPELLICAAANISDRGATPAGSNVLPFVLSGSTVRIPTNPSAVMKSTDLEGMQSPPRGYRLVKPRPILSLSSAIAVTGAAISPSMGRMSRPRLRPVLAAFNVRLGVWMPNPLAETSRKKVKEKDSAPFATSIDQLMWEFIGFNSSKSNLLYASDGGHYENLGILELLRQKCSVIWAIDASGDCPGRASALVQAILLAEAEIGCCIDVDVDAFAIPKRGERPAATHVHGSITYADNSKGKLHIVKHGGD